jgi:hypothetical protein
MNNITLTFEQVMQCIEANGRDVTYMVQGEPGIGKTTVPMKLAQKLGYSYTYMDMANMSLGDMTLPVADKEARCARYYPNEILQLHTGQPVVLCLDEWTKAGREAKNMTLPLALERRLGSIKLHPDSIVCATGNATGEGVGDSIQAHQKDRFISITQRKPTADEWISNYAIPNQIDPSVIAFVNQYPAVMQSYHDDGAQDNPYIFNPRKLLPNFVTPRSLSFASGIVKNKAKMDEAALHASLAGAIGAPAAADLVSFVHMSEELPPFASIVANPMKCAIPTKPVNRLLLTYNLILRVEKDSIGAVLKYMHRMESNEMLALFFNKMLSTSSKQWSAMVPEMTAAVAKLQRIF